MEKIINERFVHLLVLGKDGNVQEIKGYYTRPKFEELKKALTELNAVGNWEDYPEFETKK